MAICAQSYGVFCLFAIQTVLIICVSTPTDGTHLFPQHYTMIHWAGRIEKELEKVLQHVTGTQQMRSIYNEKKSQFEIKRNNPKELVERVARDISKLLISKRKALENVREFRERVPEFRERVPEFRERVPEFRERVPEFRERVPEFRGG
ncbi:voltage-dependent calcium channel subunit alpha-2/delta-2-like [Notothenia coriiceps]|uniref:Voltage-dependent calcium channel subunit alpha-2/delta-2-like n=1 Tax=Notothenia coriiceps TaxID=8208 RepID=A0A6I9NNP2_9TELE|nr:PREDICTED: voltage-dependent calcium channel subunit alpha-2/delta-2-like [Notothenia coriiceps]